MKKPSNRAQLRYNSTHPSENTAKIKINKTETNFPLFPTRTNINSLKFLKKYDFLLTKDVHEENQESYKG